MHFQEPFGPSIQPPNSPFNFQMFQLCGQLHLLDLSALVGLISVLSTLIVLYSNRFVAQLAWLQVALLGIATVITLYLCYCWQFQLLEAQKCSQRLCLSSVTQCLVGLKLVIWHSSVSGAVTMLSSNILTCN